MAWGSKKVSVPDTSAQEAELRRQTDVLMAQFQQWMAQAQTNFEQQRAGDETKFNEWRAADLAEAERQRGILQAQLDAQTAAGADAASAAEAERVRVQQAADAKATRGRQYADGRNSLIDQITQAVGTTYAGFDDNYYRQFKDSIVAAGKPQLARQHDDNKRAATFALSDTGNINSSAAARAFGRLQEALNLSEVELSDRASNAETDLRGSIDNQKRTALTSLINSAFIGDENLPDGVTDVDNALGTMTNRLNSYLTDLQTQVGSYVPMAGGVSIKAPTITQARVTTPTSALTAGLK